MDFESMRVPRDENVYSIVTIYLDSMRFRVDTMLTFICFYFFLSSISTLFKQSNIEWTLALYAFSFVCVCSFAYRLSSFNSNHCQLQKLWISLRSHDNSLSRSATVRPFNATLLKLLLLLMFLYIFCIRIFHSFIHSFCNG